MAFSKSQHCTGLALLALGASLLLLPPEVLAKASDVTGADDVKPIFEWCMAMISYVLILIGAAAGANACYQIGKVQDLKAGAISGGGAIVASGLGGKMVLGCSLLLL